MFGIEPSEFMLVALVALVVIGPKDLPKAMRFIGKWVGQARGVMRQFRSGFDAMIREAELEEMEKKWAAENERIMREHPPTPADHPMAEPATDERSPEMATKPQMTPLVPGLGSGSDPGLADIAVNPAALAPGAPDAEKPAA